MLATMNMKWLKKQRAEHEAAIQRIDDEIASRSGKRPEPPLNMEKRVKAPTVTVADRSIREKKPNGSMELHIREVLKDNPDCRSIEVIRQTPSSVYPENGYRPSWSGLYLVIQKNKVRDIWT